MKFHLSNLFNGRKALAEQEEASGEMNILKAGLLEKPESAIAQARLAAKLLRATPSSPPTDRKTT